MIVFLLPEVHPLEVPGVRLSLFVHLKCLFSWSHFARQVGSTRFRLTGIVSALCQYDPAASGFRFVGEKPAAVTLILLWAICVFSLLLWRSSLRCSEFSLLWVGVDFFRFFSSLQVWKILGYCPFKYGFFSVLSSLQLRLWLKVCYALLLRPLYLLFSSCLSLWSEFWEISSALPVQLGLICCFTHLSF